MNVRGRPRADPGRDRSGLRPDPRLVRRRAAHDWCAHGWRCPPAPHEESKSNLSLPTGSRVAKSADHHQLIQGVLADMIVDTTGARERSSTRSATERSIAATSTRKTLHAKAAVVKLAASEAAGRVVDNAVQVHGGRGYMRDFAVERLYRELRIDRVWEGTSEIQRLIIGNEIAQRGLDARARRSVRRRWARPRSEACRRVALSAAARGGRRRRELLALREAGSGSRRRAGRAAARWFAPYRASHGGARRKSPMVCTVDPSTVVECANRYAAHTGTHPLNARSSRRRRAASGRTARLDADARYRSAPPLRERRASPRRARPSARAPRRPAARARARPPPTSPAPRRRAPSPC